MPIFQNNESEAQSEIKSPQNPRAKIVRIVANIILGIVGLSTGAAIVHGMVVQKCQPPKNFFIAGVVPGDLQLAIQSQQSTDDSIDLQKCLNTNTQAPNSQTTDTKTFVAGLLPSDLPIHYAQTADNAGQNNEGTSLAGPPSDPVSSTPTNAASPGSLPWEAAPFVAQTAAPAPLAQTPTQKTTPSTQPSPSKSQATPIAHQKPPITKPATPSKPVTAPVKPATSSKIDLDKLAKAVAMTETHDCHDKIGSAVYNNCFGIKTGGRFMHFDSPAASHEYFKQLWVRGYGGGFPSYAMAKKYSGNDHPTTWLNSVKYYYGIL